MILLPFKTEYKQGLPPPAQPVELGDNESMSAVARLTPGQRPPLRLTLPG